MHRTTTAAAAALFVLLAAGCSSSTGGKSVAGATGSPTSSPAPVITATADADGVQETTPPAPELTESVDLTPQNVKLTTKVLEKDCFGSAGCNLTVRVDLGQLPAGTPSDVSFEATYELRGTSDGGTVGTISVEDGKYDPNEEFVQTSSSSKKVTAVVTDVEVTTS